MNCTDLTDSDELVARESRISAMRLIEAPALGNMERAHSWLLAHRASIRRLLHRHGFLMIKGMPIDGAADVGVARDALMDTIAVNRERTAQRTHFGHEVYSSNDLPPTHRIGFHNENSYALEFPGVLLFACLQAPSAGGCTVVADTRKVLAQLPAQIGDRYRTQGWLLTRHYHAHVGQTLESAFGSADRADIARFCDANDIGHEWLPDGTLRTTQRRTGVIKHPVTGEQALFGHMSFWSRWSLDANIRDVLIGSYGEDKLPFDTSYGDGQAITQAEMDTLNDIYERNACREPWERGDVMLIDNLLAVHGRDTFSGTRRVVVAMGELLHIDACGLSAGGSQR